MSAWRALPAVLAATCLLLFALGMSFNMMTLGGMAAAVGLVVDLAHQSVRVGEQLARRAAWRRMRVSDTSLRS